MEPRRARAYAGHGGGHPMSAGRRFVHSEFGFFKRISPELRRALYLASESLKRYFRPHRLSHTRPFGEHVNMLKGELEPRPSSGKAVASDFRPAETRRERCRPRRYNPEP